MGTSFTSFRGYGFWARDHLVAAWMANLVREIDQQRNLTKEQRAFRDDLILQASLQIAGSVADCLDHVERSEAMRKWCMKIGNRSLQEYARWGHHIDGDWLEALINAQGAVDTGRHFSTGPWSSELFLSYGEKWVRLIEGDFVPLPLNPSGKFHATGEIEVDISRPGTPPNS